MCAACHAILPDAYRIADDEVILCEVAYTNPVRAAKAQRIAELSDEVDKSGVPLRVVMIGYTGHIISDTPGRMAARIPLTMLQIAAWI